VSIGVSGAKFWFLPRWKQFCSNLVYKTSLWKLLDRQDDICCCVFYTLCYFLSFFIQFLPFFLMVPGQKLNSISIYTNDFISLILLYRTKACLNITRLMNSNVKTNSEVVILFFTQDHQALHGIEWSGLFLLVKKSFTNWIEGKKVFNIIKHSKIT
jgi:hypothetical protein